MMLFYSGIQGVSDKEKFFFWSRTFIELYGDNEPADVPARGISLKNTHNVKDVAALGRRYHINARV